MALEAQTDTPNIKEPTITPPEVDLAPSPPCTHNYILASEDQYKGLKPVITEDTPREKSVLMEWDLSTLVVPAGHPRASFISDLKHLQQDLISKGNYHIFM